MKMQDEHGQISISGALDPRKNDLLKNAEFFQGGVSPKNQILRGNLETFRIPGGRGFPHFSRGSRTNGWAPFPLYFTASILSSATYEKV